MKKIFFLFLVLFCMTGYSQEKDLPQKVASAIQEKYAGARIEAWWFENEFYYIDFAIAGRSYTAAFDQDGVWKETAEIISEMDLPQSLNDFLKSSYPSGRISYCEEVEDRDLQKFIRVSMLDAENNFHTIHSDRDGKNIVIQPTDS